MTAVDGRDGDAVQADLRAVIARAKDPRALLVIGADATPEAIRRAFHALAKRYHPTRFARSAPETLRLANEAFLAIKRAHDELLAVPGPADASTSGPILARGTTGTTTAGIPTRPRTGAVVTGATRPATTTTAPTTTAPTAPAPTATAQTTTAAGTSPPRAPRPTVPATPPPATAAVGTSPPRAPLIPPAPTAAPATARGVRFSDIPAAAGSAPRPSTMPLPVMPAAPAHPGAHPAPAHPAAHPAPAAPAAVSARAPSQVIPRPSGATAVTPRPTGAAPVIPRSTGASPVIPRPTGAAPVSPRPTGAAPGTTAPIAVAPAARPASGPTPAIASGPDEETRAAAALDLLRRRLWKDADAAYAALAAGHPAERRYRAYRHYARGRVLQDEGQLDAARAEWERALRADPTLTVAQSAIDQLPEPPKPTGGGLLSRLFKR